MNRTIGRLVALSATGLLALGGLAATPAHAATGSTVVDSDRDLMPDRWEQVNHLNPHRNDAKEDPDHDGLGNLNEMKLHGKPHDPDTDNDGSDDGDERRDHTQVDRVDTDHNGRRDGNDDRDHDGDEDRDHDGRSNEDEDDHATDACHHDGDHDGTDDEDEGDQFGTIASFDVGTGALVITTATAPVTVTVTPDTRIRYDDDIVATTPSAPDHGTDDGVGGTDDHGGRTTVDALAPGIGVAEVEYHHGALEQVELIRPAPPA